MVQYRKEAVRQQTEIKEESSMENMSRRSFLRNTLVGAAGLAATGILGTIGAVAEGKTTYNPGTYRATARVTRRWMRKARMWMEFPAAP